MGLTVTSLAEAKALFCDILGMTLLREDTTYHACFVTDGKIMISIWKAKCLTPVAFNRHENLGLHHFALTVESDEELHRLYADLKAASFPVEFSPEHLRGGPARHFIFQGLAGFESNLLVSKKD